jgi:hypothetical protein
MMQEERTTDPALVTGPRDTGRYVGSYGWKKRFRRPEWSHLYVVARRGAGETDLPGGVWTHLYRIADDAWSSRAVVYLETVLKGDCMVRGLAKAKEVIEIVTGPSGSAQSRSSSVDIGTVRQWIRRTGRLWRPQDLSSAGVLPATAGIPGGLRGRRILTETTMDFILRLQCDDVLGAKIERETPTGLVTIATAMPRDGSWEVQLLDSPAAAGLEFLSGLRARDCRDLRRQLARPNVMVVMPDV